MGKRDRRVDAHIAKAAGFAQPILEFIRETAHAAVPEVEDGRIFENVRSLKDLPPKNRKAAAAWDKFAPTSHRREYVTWIIDAKTDETRKRRIGQAIEWIGEGKQRNWKYRNS